MDLFKPDLARTFLPGSSSVPAADLDIFLICNSSTHTIAWFLLISVLSLCKKSLRTSAILEWIRWTFAFAFFQLLLNLVLQLIFCCALRNAASCRLKLFNGSILRPSEKPAKLLIPRSIPFAGSAQTSSGSNGTHTGNSLRTAYLKEAPRSASSSLRINRWHLFSFSQ
jgi:hypothetical protein